MFAASKTASLSGYQIQRSLRFNSADTTYLSRTFTSASNRKTWTWSGWVKRSGFSSNSALFTCYFADNDNSNFALLFDSSNQLTVSLHTVNAFQTTPVYRDPSGWYHIVLAVDTTQASASNRMKVYVNGSQITTFVTNNLSSISQNQDLSINSANSHLIGGMNLVGWVYNGYMTEVNFIDGQALTPSSFGQTNANTGVWEPKPYAGTYGTNGFYLNFSDNSNTTATTLGKDYSGNGNNWTPNNFSVSAGAGNDSLVDVPTPWGTDTGVGGTVRGNYCTLNPLAKGASASLANGNLDYSVPSASNDPCVTSTIGMSSGKWYAEFTVVSSSEVVVGISNTPTSLGLYVGANPTSWGYYGTNGNKVNSASSVAYGASFTTNDVIGVAFDADVGTLTFYKNGVSQGTAYSGLPANTYYFATGNNNTGAGVYSNFGQRPFAYTAPSGFKALCTQNLPTPTIGATAATQAEDYFNAALYTGDRTDRTITVGFQPDFVWVKSRSAVDDHYLMNSLSGTGKYLVSNSTAAEATNANVLTAFTSGGFSVGNTGTTNETGRTYVAWNWKANGAGVTNTAGSITSTVSANTTSGFSVVTYTGNGSAGATVGHGLGSAPKMIIVKSRSAAGSWVVYQASLGATKGMFVNLTDAAYTATAYWNDTAPSSSVFTLGTRTESNNNGSTYVAYCFAEVPGFSKFGSYTGNNSADGPFVFTGFRPAYVMIKSSTLGDGTANWVIKDKLRAAAYNPQDGNLYANLSGAEDTTSTVYIDFLSNGFKIRGNYAGINAVHTYIFAAFAETPQKFALAR